VGDGAFRKNADQIAVLQRLCHRLERRFPERGIVAFRGDGDGTAGSEHEAQDRRLEDLVVHDEADGPAAGGHDHQGIDEADVITCDHRGAGFGNRVDAFHPQPVDRVHQHPDDETHQELGHQLEDVHRHGGVQQADDEEQLRNGEPGV